MQHTSAFRTGNANRPRPRNFILATNQIVLDARVCRSAATNTDYRPTPSHAREQALRTNIRRRDMLGISRAKAVPLDTGQTTPQGAIDRTAIGSPTRRRRPHDRGEPAVASAIGRLRRECSAAAARWSAAPQAACLSAPSTPRPHRMRRMHRCGIQSAGCSPSYQHRHAPAGDSGL